MCSFFFHELQLITVKIKIKIIENNRKDTDSFAPRPLIFKLQQEVLKFNDIDVLRTSVFLSNL